MKYYVGIDVGGTFIKGGVIDAEGNISVQDKVPTPRVYEEAVDAIAILVTSLSATADVTISGIGIGTPSIIDSERGFMVYSSNLFWTNKTFAKNVSEKCGISYVKILNDANAAALGEYAYGAGKDTRHMVMVTLGTGIGSGVIISGRLYEGNRCAGGELGHMIIHPRGLACTCGNRGCWEAYGSAGALSRQAWRYADAHRDSALWQACEGDVNKMNGHVIFDALQAGDRGAKRVVDRYLDQVALGLVNIANSLRPEVIVIGGGISAVGETLTSRLETYVNARLFGGSTHAPVRIVPASRGNDAGMLGAVRFLLDSLAQA